MIRSKIIFIIFIFACLGLQAQSLRGLQENPAIRDHISKQPKMLKSTQSAFVLSLPFFDDFSNTSVFPDPDLWSDRYAFVNNSYALEPISVGVITLDAIDEAGEVYSISGGPISSDTLTSRELDLSAYANSDDTVRLSFFFQCGGRGETPELNDSLVLEYYHQPTDTWTQSWFVNRNAPSAFEQVILKIPHTFYNQNFRFRFRNYTSISIDDVSGGEGALSNADCWNIDYVMLNTNTELYHQRIGNDVTIVDIPRKLLDFYETVPWSHMDSALSISLNKINFDIRHMLPPGDSINIGRNYFVRNLNTGRLEEFEEQFEQFHTDTFLLHRNLDFSGTFIGDDNSAESQFEVTSYLVTNDGPKQNDTSKIILNFKDSYVYDDGTPEYGFGIEGPSMTGALLALRFRVYRIDTLRAVDMLFNKARGHYNENLKFQLCVWKDAGGRPGDLIYMSDEEYSPDLSGGMLDFKRYPIMSGEEIIVTDSVVYVGWKQLTDEFLNLGYDVNRNNLSRTFINSSGSWNNQLGSLIPGTIMMRAVFGNKNVVTGPDKIPDNSDIVLYPNPVSRILTIESGGIMIKHLTMVDISGRIVLQQSGNSRTVDVSSFSPGMYHVIITTGNQPPLIYKIIVSQ